MIEAYGHGFLREFVIGDLLGLRVYFSAAGVCLDVRESIGNTGRSDIFGIVQLSGKPGEKLNYWKIGWKELEAQRREGICFFCQPRSQDEGRGDSHGVALWFMDMLALLIYTPGMALS